MSTTAHVDAKPRRHPCPWPGCTALAKASQWGCRLHWFTLPIRTRQAIHATRVPHQASHGHVSRSHVRVLGEAQAWIEQHLKEAANAR
nr:hypothetical protein [uncultured Roseateles sp.]